MASRKSSSWSFVRGHGNHKVAYFHQDHKEESQPNNNHAKQSRINLQERFGQRRNERSADAVGGHPSHSHPTSPPHLCGPGYSAILQHVLHPKHRLYRAWNDFGSSGPPKTPDSGRQTRSSFRQLPQLLNHLQENMSSLRPQTSQMLREGGQKMNRALQGVRTSVLAFSQRFRDSTRRRYKLDGTPNRTPNRTPIRRHNTPGKLYSPFDISTPITPKSYKGPKRLQRGTPRSMYGNENRALARTPQESRARSHHQQQQQQNWVQFHSPSRRLHHDVAAINHGTEEFDRIARGMLRRSMRD